MANLPMVKSGPALLALFIFSGHAAAATYEVGPGQNLTNIGDVPWESLGPGDLVRIHHRDTPYNEKWVIGTSGTESQPIVVQGVLGPQGQRPIIDGSGATTRSELNYWNRPRGVLKIGGTSDPPDVLPQWIVVENLHIRGAHASNSFEDGGGQTTYADNAAAFYVERAANLWVRNCELEGSGNGLFIGAHGGDTQNIVIAKNHIHNNGNVGSIYEHNSYTAAINITFEGNHYGPPCDGCLGNNLKDRSAGLVVRHNWLEGGNRQLDLVDAEDSQVLVNHPTYNETFVYGNVLVEREGDGNSQILHYGGDSGTTSDYRKGTLYFMHNTLVSSRSGNTTLLRLSTNDENAVVMNNILYATEGGNRLALYGGEGQVQLAGNWLNENFRDTFDSDNGGAITDDGNNLTGTDPGFENLAGQAFGLTETSAALDNAVALPATVLPEHAVAAQYVVHQDLEDRPNDGAPDRGAFERCPPPCTAPMPDAGTSPMDGGDALPADAGSNANPESGTNEAMDGGHGGQPDSEDGGGNENMEQTEAGCGCKADDTASPRAVFFLLGLAIFFHRRRTSERRQ